MIMRSSQLLKPPTRWLPSEKHMQIDTNTHGKQRQRFKAPGGGVQAPKSPKWEAHADTHTHIGTHAHTHTHTEHTHTHSHRAHQKDTHMDTCIHAGAYDAYSCTTHIHHTQVRVRLR